MLWQPDVLLDGSVFCIVHGKFFAKSIYLTVSNDSWLLGLICFAGWSKCWC